MPEERAELRRLRGARRRHLIVWDDKPVGLLIGDEGPGWWIVWPIPVRRDVVPAVPINERHELRFSRAKGWALRHARQMAESAG